MSWVEEKTDESLELLSIGISWAGYLGLVVAVVWFWVNRSSQRDLGLLARFAGLATSIIFVYTMICLYGSVCALVFQLNQLKPYDQVVVLESLADGVHAGIEHAFLTAGYLATCLLAHMRLVHLRLLQLEAKQNPDALSHRGR